jgi:hypothetical protein
MRRYDGLHDTLSIGIVYPYLCRIVRRRYGDAYITVSHRTDLGVGDMLCGESLDIGEIQDI